MDSAESNQNWWGRNWKWFVPVLCLGSLAAFCALICAIMFFVMGMMKSSDVYNHAWNAAIESQEVTAFTGEPIESGWFVTGNISTSNSSGEADLRIPIEGPEGEGHIRVVAEKTEGRWEYETLIFVPENRPFIDLGSSESGP